MVEFIDANADFLFAVWLTVAISLSFVSGTLAELAESRGQRGPDIVAATTVAMLWPLAGVAGIAFTLAARYRKWRG